MITIVPARVVTDVTNEEQTIHCYPIDGARRSSGAEVINGLFT